MSSLQNTIDETAVVRPETTLSDSSWYAIQTLPRHEKKIAAELSQKSINSFLPLVSEKHQWSDRRVSVNTPLFPG